VSKMQQFVRFSVLENANTCLCTANLFAGLKSLTVLNSKLPVSLFAALMAQPLPIFLISFPAIPPSRELRSGDKNLLICKPFRLTLFGKRAFSCAALLLWNSLHDPVRQAPNLNTFRSLVICHLRSKNCN
jgi:hypothetical protein